MSLIALRTDVAAYLDTELGGLTALMGKPVTVSTHEGAFTEKTLERCARATPAVVVSFQAVEISIEGGVTAADVDTMVTCITKDGAGPSRKRDVLGLILVAEVLRLLGTYVSSVVSGHRRGTDFKAVNYYSEKIAKQGCHLWGIAYKQRVDIPEAVVTNLDDLLTTYASWDLAPTDGEYEAEDSIGTPLP